MDSDDDISEKARPWLVRAGLVEVGHVPMRDASAWFVRSVPTMHHAARLFEMVERGLGEHGWPDPARPEGQGSLHQRDPERPEWISGVPVLEMAFAGTTSVTVAAFQFGPERKKAPPLIDPDIVPTRPMMRAGEITVREGAASFQIEYGPEGVARGGCQSRFDAATLAYQGKTKPARAGRADVSAVVCSSADFLRCDSRRERSRPSRPR